MISRGSAALSVALAAAGITAAAIPPGASASTSQIAIIQDGGAIAGNPVADATFRQFRSLGATYARIFVSWSGVAPQNSSSTEPAGFNATDPNAYGNAWSVYDQAVEDAARYGIKVDLIVAGGAPQWAEPPVPTVTHYNPFFAFNMDMQKWGQFVTAITTRYDGHFTPAGSSTPLPAVHFWTVWNEPNFGEDLGPQAIDGSKYSVAPAMYRQVLNAAWGPLHINGHSHDTILAGGYAARGLVGRPTGGHPQGLPGYFGQTKPLTFIRTMYCLNTKYKPLKGKTATEEGCPTSKSAQRKFRSQNPALFSASGVADHPYPDNGSPLTDGKGDPNFASFPDLGNLAKTMDKVVRHYGSHKKFAIYNDEYGYITHPPARSHYLSPAKAAVDINWAEFLSYKNPRVKSYMQYEVKDPTQQAGPYAGFASGLEDPSGQKKATYAAYNLPVWMPVTSFKHSKKVEVWGDARPANFEKHFGAQSVQIQLQKGGHGSWKTIKTEKITKSGGYFDDTKVKFPGGGNVRLAYTYPNNDPLLPLGLGGTTITSRSFKIKVH
jgi:hypothetical protein